MNEHVDYSSSTTAISLLDAISSVIDHQVTSQINESPIVTILADEITDITVRHKLCINKQAAQKIPAMQKYQKTLETIYYHFKHSSKKIDTLSAIQDVLDEPQLKYREVHQVRWLSFYEALMAIQRTLDSLITYLIEQSKHDAVANGLKKSVAQELFISLTYSMIDILEPIMTLSLTLQKKDLDIGIVQVSSQSSDRFFSISQIISLKHPWRSG